MKFPSKMLPLEPKHLLNPLVILNFRYQNIYTYVCDWWFRLAGLWTHHTYSPVNSPLSTLGCRCGLKCPPPGHYPRPAEIDSRCIPMSSQEKKLAIGQLSSLKSV